MTYTVRPARRSQAKPLIACFSQSGAGKTYSGLLLARGFVGPSGKIDMIETEQGRGESYADPAEYPEIGGYNVISMRNNFSPIEYGKAITAAEQDNPDALIIDSASHEWEGIGGVLQWAAKNEDDGKKSMQIWKDPKMHHTQDFVLRIMSTPIPLVIVNMRAKYHMRPEKPGSTKFVRSEDLEPIQSEDFLFEMFMHFWIEMGNHKVHITKSTNRSLADAIRDGEPITLDSGRRLREWANGRLSSQQEPEKIILQTPEGPSTFSKWSEFLGALEQLLRGPSPYDAWMANAEAFNNGMAKNSSNPKAMARFNEVGKLAMALTTPADSDQL